MGDFLRYDHFNKLDAAVVVISQQGEVIYRNQAALCITRRFRLGGRLFSCFACGAAGMETCFRRRKISIEKLNVNGEMRSVLLIPDRSPEGKQMILVMTPCLEGEFCYAASGAERMPEPFVEGTAALPTVEDLTPMGELLIRAYAQLPQGLCGLLDDAQGFTVGGACLFLNRLFERRFAARKPSASAKCAEDALLLPFPRFRELSSCLACLSVILAVNAKGRMLTVTFLSENDRHKICFSYDTPSNDAKTLSELIPARKVEFSIIEALLDLLSFDVETFCADGQQHVVLYGRDRIPPQGLRSPSSENFDLEIMLVEELLSELGAGI